MRYLLLLSLCFGQNTHDAMWRGQEYADSTWRADFDTSLIYKPQIEFIVTEREPPVWQLEWSDQDSTISMFITEGVTMDSVAKSFFQLLEDQYGLKLNRKEKQ